MEWTLKGSPNWRTERQKSQLGVDSIHKRKEETTGTNQEEHFHIRKVDADWTLDIRKVDAD